jgi:hypothetical protein
MTDPESAYVTAGGYGRTVRQLEAMA